MYVEESQEEGWAPGAYLLPLQHHPDSPSCITRTNSTNGTPRVHSIIYDTLLYPYTLQVYFNLCVYVSCTQILLDILVELY